MSDLDLARQWATALAKLTTIGVERDALTRQYDTLRGTVDDHAKALRETLGSNRPQRLFDLGDGQMVMVSVTRGVERVEVEKADGKD